MKKRIFAAALAAAMLCAVLSGCSGSSSSSAAASSASESAAPQANEITVGIAQDLDESLDPHLAVAAGTKEVMFNVFEGLMKPTSDGDLTPAIAESYTLSDDQKTYTFTLRQGVKFHNGETVIADDVVYSIQRCADATAGEPLVPAFKAIESVEKVDDQTVAITLKAPDNEFLAYLTTAILPADYDQQDTAPVGTGPFKFISRTAQDSIVLEKFDEYWGTPAQLDQSQFNVLEGTMNLVQAMYLNNDVAPFDDVRVRQALSYAVDKQQIMDMIADGHGAAFGSSMYPAFGKYFVPELTDYYTRNIEKAKELLTEAGYPDGFDMTITVPSNYQPHMDTAQVLVEQLKAIGVNATIQPVEWASWLSDVYTGRQYQATVVGVDASNMTARALLERFTSTASNNFINYNDPEYDALFAQAQATADDAEQTALYKQMETRLAENAANVYIQDLADLVAMRSNLDGLNFYPIYVLDLSTVHYVQ